MSALYVLSLLIMVACLPFQAVHAQGHDDLQWQAWEAYQNGDYARCADLYSEVIALKVSVSDQTLYNGACCFALLDQEDKAFSHLLAAVDAGFNDAEHLQSDEDLVALRNDPRWTPLVNRVLEERAAYLETINMEMYNIYQQDQSDRSIAANNTAAADLESIDLEELARRDQIRRKQTRILLESNQLSAPDDFYHAAMIFQHGGNAESYALARNLAQKAVELDSSLSKAKWLSAAAHDRYLWAMGEPQMYGTQIQQDSTGVWTLQPIDVSAVTDEVRLDHGVPPIEKVMQQIDLMNRTGDN